MTNYSEVLQAVNQLVAQLLKLIQQEKRCFRYYLRRKGHSSDQAFIKEIQGFVSSSRASFSKLIDQVDIDSLSKPTKLRLQLKIRDILNARISFISELPGGVKAKLESALTLEHELQEDISNLCLFNQDIYFILYQLTRLIAYNSHDLTLFKKQIKKCAPRHSVEELPDLDQILCLTQMQNPHKFEKQKKLVQSSVIFRDQVVFESETARLIKEGMFQSLSTREQLMAPKVHNHEHVTSCESRIKQSKDQQKTNDRKLATRLRYRRPAKQKSGPRKWMKLEQSPKCVYPSGSGKTLFVVSRMTTRDRLSRQQQEQQRKIIFFNSVLQL